jgi:hypothetical protein
MAAVPVYDAMRVPIALERLALLVAGQDVDDSCGPHGNSFSWLLLEV